MISRFGIFRNCRYGNTNMQKSPFTRRQEVLASLLRQVRKEQRLRQVDLAKRLGEPQSFISKYESGERRLDLPELEQVCQAMGIPLSDFVQRYEEANG
jgi:transcriptional regulator with XRE-family HTH domain